MMESKNKSSSSSSNPKKKKRRSQAVAFGRTYFHALGGTTPARVVSRPMMIHATTTTTTTNMIGGNDDDEYATSNNALNENNNNKQTNSNHTLMCYQWKYPPWMKSTKKQSNNINSKENNNNDADDDDGIDHDDPSAIIVQAVATSQSTLFLTEAGKVYQTGTLHGHVYTRPTLITIAMPLKCVEIAAGRHFCLARMQDGLAVLSFGAGHFGQLGVQSPANNNSDDDDDDDDENSNNNSSSPSSSSAAERQITFTSRPILIEGLLPRAVGSPIQQIAAGDWHGMALTVSGRVFCWGSNRSQQCGRKPPNSGNSSNGGSANPAPTILTPAPVPFAKEQSSSSPSVASDWLRIAKIAAGRSHSVALTRETGQVYCWGSTLYGQCGNFVRRTPVVPPRRVEGLQDLSMVQIAAAGCHTLALTSGGRVFGWGQCHEGQLGVAMPNITTPNNSNNDSSSDFYSRTTTAITVTAATPRPRLVADLDFVAIAAGQEWKTQQKIQQRQMEKESEVTATANNDDNINNTAATSIINDHQDSTSVESSSLSSPPPPPEIANNDAASATTTTTDSVVASPLSTIPRITQIYAGAFYSVAVSSSGHVYTFGSNDAGQLGVSTPRDLPFRETGHPYKKPIANGVSSSTMTATTTATGVAVPPSTVRELNAQSFDSRHLVLLPVRVEAAMSINVRTVACGPNHLWCIGEERDDSDPGANVIGRTLYEVQEGNRRQTLLRTRAHRQQPQQAHDFGSSGVILLPAPQSKPPPTRNREEVEAKATIGTSSQLPNLEVRPSPLVDFLSPNDLPSPATTTTTVAADGLLTPSTDGVAEKAEEEVESISTSSSPEVASELTNITATATATPSATASASGQTDSNKAPSSSLPGSIPNRNVKRTRSRGIIRRLSSGIRKRLGGGGSKVKQEGGQLSLDTESERGHNHHHRRSRNHQNNNNNTATEVNEVGGGGDVSRTRWMRKRNTIG